MQKNKNQSKDIEYIKEVLLHPRERLKRKKKTRTRSTIYKNTAATTSRLIE